MAFNFGDFILEMKADSRELDAGMKLATVTVTKSVNAMGKEAQKFSARFQAEVKKASRSLISDSGLDGALKRAGKTIRDTRSDVKLMAEPFKLVAGIVTGPFSLGFKVAGVAMKTVGAIGKTVTSVISVGFKTVGTVIGGAAKVIGGVFKGALNAVVGVGKSVVGIFTTGLTKVASIFTNIGQAAFRLSVSLTALGAAGTAAFGGIARASAEFEQEATNTAAVSGLLGAAFDQGREKIKAMALELGERTVFTARQAASAMTDLARKGFRPVNLEAGQLKPLLDFAAATLTDLQTSTQLTTSTLNAFGLTFKDSGKVADIFAKAITSTAATVEFFSTSMSFVGPIAKSAGISLEETVAALGFLADRGIRASTAGTALRKAISSLVKPTRGAKEALADMGLSAKDVDVRSKGLTGVLHTLRDAGLDTEKAFAIFGLRAAPAISTLVGIGDSAANSVGAFQNLTKELKNSAGTAEQVADQQLDTLQGQFTLLKSAIESVVIKLGEALGPAVRSVVEAIRPMVLSLGEWIEKNDTLIQEQFSAFAEKVIDVATKIATWVKNNKELVVQIVIMAAKAAAVAAVFGPLLLMVSGMLSGVGGLTRAFGLLISTVLNPLSIVLGLVALAFRATGVTFEQVRNQFLNFMESFKTRLTFAEGTVDFWTQLWSDAGALLGTIWAGMKSNFDAFVLNFQAIVRQFNTDLKDENFSTWDAIKALIQNVFVEILATAMGFAASILVPFGITTDAFNDVWGTAAKVMDGITRWMDIARLSIEIFALDVELFLLRSGISLRDSEGAWVGWKETIKVLIEEVKRFLLDVKFNIEKMVDSGKGKFRELKTDVTNFFRDAMTAAEPFLAVLNAIVTVAKEVAFVAGKVGGFIVGAAQGAGELAGTAAGNLGFADGTSNFRGGPAIVGEEGPELVTNIPKGAQIIPNHELGGGVNISFNGPVNMRSREDVDALADKISRAMFFDSRRKRRQFGIGG